MPKQQLERDFEYASGELLDARMRRIWFHKWLALAKNMKEFRSKEKEKASNFEQEFVLRQQQRQPRVSELSVTISR